MFWLCRANGDHDGAGFKDSEVTDVDLVTAALSRANSGDNDDDGHDDVEVDAVGGGQDQGDAWGFGSKANSTSALGMGGRLPQRPLGPVAAMPVAKDADAYNMRHR